MRDAPDHHDSRTRIVRPPRVSKSSIDAPAHTTPSAHTDGAPLRRADLIAIQRLAGNRAAGITVQRGIIDWAKDKLGIRENEAELDAYEDGLDELEEFRGKVHHDDNQAYGSRSYDPTDGSLSITIRCGFKFIPGTKTELDPPQPSDPNTPWAPHIKKVPVLWTDDEMAGWKAKFLGQATEKWNGQHTFYCQRDWWEDLKARTKIQFVEASADQRPTTPGDNLHFYVTVYKEHDDIPHDEGPGRSNVWGMDAKLAKPDVDTDSHAKGATTAQHEAGHMLGLGDEYPGAPKCPIHGTASHSGMVMAEFGHEVVCAKADPESIMAKGAKVLPEHGVVFLADLKRITKMEQWAHTPKTPRPPPQREPGDSPPVPGGPAPAPAVSRPLPPPPGSHT